MGVKGFLKIAIVPLVLVGAYAGTVYQQTGGGYQTTTTLINKKVEFSGIKSLEKENTNLIIIHGIGNHCIGYADTLVTSLINKLSSDQWRNEQKGYSRYLAEAIDSNKKARARDAQIKKIFPPRDGHCKINRDDEKLTAHFDELDGLDQKEIDNYDEFELGSDELGNIDLEAVMLQQEKLCESIHKMDTDTVDCYKLYVNKLSKKLPGDEQHSITSEQYVIGFIRRVTKNISDNKRLKVFEVTWNPATRWIKNSLLLPEHINGKLSHHIVNREMKSEIVNIAMADALAYLSDSGILINFDILQAFCFALADPQSTPNDNNAFACDKDHLRHAPNDFSEKNDVVLISHSLGTRILFDTLGLLSLGASDKSGMNLVGLIKTRFEAIGAEFPKEYSDTTDLDEKGFSGLLADRIPGFIQAIRSIYLFTNQIPLLEANITSPFNSNHSISVGFNDFLKLRSKSSEKVALQAGTSIKKDLLQIVSFHDPDDLLSYNLRCWYHGTILKQKEETKDILDKKVIELALTILDDNDQACWYQHREDGKYEKECPGVVKTMGEIRRTLRDTLFNICNEEQLKARVEEGDLEALIDFDSLKALYNDIWNEQKEFVLIDASVRLSVDSKIPLLFADPGKVHSNYFVDDTIHDWLINGNQVEEM